MAARLGELLIQAGLLTEAEVVEGLRVQVIWGGRLGTVLSELGYVDLDTLSRVLGWQHEMPAALFKHFEHADRELQSTLGSDLAQTYGCIPLLRAGKRIVIACISPLDGATTEIIARALGVAPDLIIPSVAAELRIRYQLEHVYKISRPHRFLRAHGTELTSGEARPTLVAEAIPDLTADLDDVFPEELFDQPSEANASAERRTYLRTLGDGVVEPLGGAAREPSTPTSLTTSADRDDKTLQALRSATERGDIAALAVEAVGAQVVACRAATLLVVRGQAATSWTSFRRTGVMTDALAISLDRPGLARTVIQRRAAVHAAAGDLTEADFLLLTALNPDEGDLIIAPIIADGTVVALLVVAITPGASADGLGPITEATGAAFARLMREASQPTNTR
jgi:hypothetical protein